MWYVYFLRLANGDVYVGFARDLKARIKRHNSGQVRSTKAHLPVSLLSYVAVLDRPTAVALETYFKSGSGKAFAYKRLWA